MAGLPNPVRCKAKQVPMTRPAEGPGTPQREMVIQDRIRLTGLLRKALQMQGFLFRCASPVHHDRTLAVSSPSLGSAELALGVRQRRSAEAASAVLPPQTRARAADSLEAVRCGGLAVLAEPMYALGAPHLKGARSASHCASAATAR